MNLIIIKINSVDVDNYHNFSGESVGQEKD